MSGAMLPAAPPSADLPRAWVVFCGQADLFWLRLLRRGFRHCFAVLNDGERWITIDPLSPCLEIAVQPVPAAFDLPCWLRERGHVVVPATVGRGHGRPAPWAPFTCVEAVKRVIGLHDRFVLTPWQLYRRLTRI